MDESEDGLKMTEAMDLMMEKLRAKHHMYKIFNEYSKSLISTLVDKRYPLEAMEKNYLKQCLEVLEKNITVTTRSMFVERLETISRNLGLKFVSGPTGLDWFISSDMFYIEVVLEPDSTVKDVKIHHEGCEEQQNCEELAKSLNEKDFKDLTLQLEGLIAIYSLNAEKKIKTKAFNSLRSLEYDLLALAKMPDHESSPYTTAVQSSVGYVKPRSGGHPMKLAYFTTPYNLSGSGVIVPDVWDIDYAVSVCLEASSSNKLQTGSLLNTSESSKNSVFHKLTSDNSASLPARFLLKLKEPIVMCDNLISAIESVTKIEVVRTDNASPVLSLLRRQYLPENGQSCDYYYVTLTDQMHRYTFTEHKTGLKASLLHGIPFTHPAHVSEVIAILRKQALFNSLLVSCLYATKERENKRLNNQNERNKNYALDDENRGKFDTNDNRNDCADKPSNWDENVVFEVEALTWKKIMITFAHPVDTSIATAELYLDSITEPMCRVNVITEQDECGGPHELSQEWATKVLRCTLSIPVCMRGVLAALESEYGGGAVNNNDDGDDDDDDEEEEEEEEEGEEEEDEEEHGCTNKEGALFRTNLNTLARNLATFKFNNKNGRGVVGNSKGGGGGGGNNDPCGFPKVMFTPGSPAVRDEDAFTGEEDFWGNFPRRVPDAFMNFSQPESLSPPSGAVSPSIPQLFQSLMQENSPIYEQMRGKGEGKFVAAEGRREATETFDGREGAGVVFDLAAGNMDVEDILFGESPKVKVEEEGDVEMKSSEGGENEGSKSDAALEDLENIEEFLKMTHNKVGMTMPTSAKETEAPPPPSPSTISILADLESPNEPAIAHAPTNEEIVQSVLNSIGLERRPGFEIIPGCAKPPPSAPTFLSSSLTITPIPAEDRSSGGMMKDQMKKSGKFSDRISSASSAGGEKGLKKKRPREEAAMGPPEKIPNKNLDALSKPVSVSIKPAETLSRSPSPSSRYTSSPTSLFGKSPIGSPKFGGKSGGNSPLQFPSSPKTSPKHGSGKTSSGTVGTTTAKTMPPLAAIGRSGSLDSAKGKSLKESKERKSESPKLKTSTTAGTAGKFGKNLADLAELAQLEAAAAAGPQAKNKKGSVLTAVIDKILKKQCSDDGTDECGGGGKVVGGGGEEIAVKKGPGEYMVKPSSDGMKITINKKIKELSSSSSSAVKGGNNFLPSNKMGFDLSKTGLKAGVSSGPACKKSSSKGGGGVLALPGPSGYKTTAGPNFGKNAAVTTGGGFSPKSKSKSSTGSDQKKRMKLSEKKGEEEGGFKPFMPAKPFDTKFQIPKLSKSGDGEGNNNNNNNNRKEEGQQQSVEAVDMMGKEAAKEASKLQPVSQEDTTQPVEATTGSSPISIVPIISPFAPPTTTGQSTSPEYVVNID